MIKEFITSGWIVKGRAILEVNCLTVLEADLFSDRVKHIAYTDIQRVYAGSVFPPVLHILAYVGLFIVGLVLIPSFAWLGLPIAAVVVALMVVEISRRRTVIIVVCGGYPTKLKKDGMKYEDRREFVDELLRRIATAQSPRPADGDA